MHVRKLFFLYYKKRIVCMPRGLIFGSRWDRYAAQSNPDPTPVPEAPAHGGAEVSDAVVAVPVHPRTGKALAKPPKDPKEEPTYKLRKALGLVKSEPNTKGATS